MTHPHVNISLWIHVHAYALVLFLRQKTAGYSGLPGTLVSRVRTLVAEGPSSRPSAQAGAPFPALGLKEVATSRTTSQMVLGESLLSMNMLCPESFLFHNGELRLLEPRAGERLVSSFCVLPFVVLPQARAQSYHLEWGARRWKEWGGKRDAGREIQGQAAHTSLWVVCC